MFRKLIILAVSLLGMAGLALGLSSTAGAATTGAYPTATPSVTPTHPIVPPPVVSPFAHCAFTTTFANTFDAAQHRWIFRAVPAIVCNTRNGVEVFDLVR
jgi:hypothetical protein